MQCSSVCTASAYVAADRRSGRHPEWSGVEGSGEERRGEERRQASHRVRQMRVQQWSGVFLPHQSRLGKVCITQYNNNVLVR